MKGRAGREGAVCFISKLTSCVQVEFDSFAGDGPGTAGSEYEEMLCYVKEEVPPAQLGQYPDTAGLPFSPNFRTRPPYLIVAGSIQHNGLNVHDSHRTWVSSVSHALKYASNT